MHHSGGSSHGYRISSTDPTVPHKRHWQFCVGSGHALLALRTDYVKQLRFIHDTLDIERVRFHGIFCDDMPTCNDLSVQMSVPGAEQFTEHNFNACALAYDNVLEAGMKPFVELSFMPERLALKEENRPMKDGFFYKPNIVPPPRGLRRLAGIRSGLCPLPDPPLRA